MTISKHEIAKRRRARRLAIQALYEWTIASGDITAINQEFQRLNNMLKVDVDYFEQLLFGITQHITELDTTVTSHLDRPLNEINPVEHQILRLGIYELTHCLDLSAPIILNEAVELAKKFGATDSYKYVNGVLNKAAKQLRPDES